MIHKYSLLIFSVLFAFASSAQAVIVKGEVWRKKREDGTCQYIYCLSDMHNDQQYPEQMNEQRIQLLSRLAQCNPQRTKILVEDEVALAPASFDHVGTEDQPKALLSFLSTLCSKKGMDVSNVDDRYMVNSMLHITHLKSLLHNVEIGNGPWSDDEKACLKKEYLAELKKWGDDNSIEQIAHVLEQGATRAQLDAVNKECALYKFLNKNKSGLCLFDQMPVNLDIEAREWLCRLIEWGIQYLPFIDLKTTNMVTDFSQQNDVDTIFIIMGAAHIAHLTPQLIDLGYESAKHSGDEYLDEILTQNYDRQTKMVDFLSSIDLQELLDGKIDIQEIENACQKLFSKSMLSGGCIPKPLEHLDIFFTTK